MLNEIKHKLSLLVDNTHKPEQFFKKNEKEQDTCNNFIGVRMPDIRTLTKELKQELSFENNQEILKALLTSAINEERMLALLLLVEFFKKNSENIYNFYIENIEYVANWNLVDSSAHLIIGPFLLKKSVHQLQTINQINQLAASQNLWLRRVAMVATWWPIRKNEYEITCSIAKKLMNDGEDLVCKAVGWMMREIGERDQGIMLNFLNEHKNFLSRITLRNMLEKLPVDLKKQYLA